MDVHPGSTHDVVACMLASTHVCISPFMAPATANNQPMEAPRDIRPLTPNCPLKAITATNAPQQPLVQPLGPPQRSTDRVGDMQVAKANAQRQHGFSEQPPPMQLPNMDDEYERAMWQKRLHLEHLQKTKQSSRPKEKLVKGDEANKQSRVGKKRPKPSKIAVAESVEDDSDEEEPAKKTTTLSGP
eukprot:scaffold36617_cov45-Prasinocladus_malaysianus.AAC.1